MGLRKFTAYTATDTSLVTTAETVIATLSGVSTNQPGQTVSLSGSATLSTGASTTGVTFRVREDSLSGTVVGESAPDVLEGAAGSVETHTIDVATSLLGEFSGKTFVLTAQQVAAAANGNVTQASLSAEVTP